MTPGLTHLDDAGAARMVDVSAKPVTAREATAAGRVRCSARVLELLRGSGVPKGDALAVARLAGIQAAKRTPDLVPLAHPVAVHGVVVDLQIAEDAVTISATVRTADRTGVEMEALTCVAVAGLALIDMIKGVDRAAELTDVRVLAKSGGRSGSFRAPDRPDPEIPTPGPGTPGFETAPVPGAAGRALVVTASNRAATGVYADRSGPLLVVGLVAMGFAVDGPAVVPDGDPVEEQLRAAVEAGYRVVLTTGGTGISPTDRTPEATARVLDRQLPGLADAIRAYGIRVGVPTAALSRGLAGVAGGTVIVNLPGSSGGCRDGLAVLREVLPHAVEQVRGADHESSAGGPDR